MDWLRDREMDSQKPTSGTPLHIVTPAVFPLPTVILAGVDRGLSK
jgi:hypothetical protein